MRWDGGQQDVDEHDDLYFKLALLALSKDDLKVARGSPTVDECANREAEHLNASITVALGLGLRRREQLNLLCDQVDFSRNVVVATKTKGERIVKSLWTS